MDVVPTLVADGQAAVLRQPGQGPFDHPTIPPEPLAALDPLPSNPALDPPTMQKPSAPRDVVALVGMHLLRPLASAPTGGLDWWDGIDEPLEAHRIVPVGAAQETGERDAASVDHQMALRARFAFIRGIRPDSIAPFLRAHSRNPA